MVYDIFYKENVIDQASPLWFNYPVDSRKSRREAGRPGWSATKSALFKKNH
jgi:hypothetical protein